MRFILVIFTCVFLNALLAGCGPPYKSDGDDLLDHTSMHSSRYHVEGREIHYVERDGIGATILFIHGTPGTWKAFGAYLADDELASRAQLISVDRPGFGGSSGGGVVRSLSDQARLLSPLLQRAQGAEKIVLVGHSLGAPLAARIALAYPDNIAGLLLIAPSLDPVLEKPRWYNRLASHAMLQWLVPDRLQRANVEVMALADELQEMVPLWQSLRIPVTVIQGMEDKLVDPANIDFLGDHIAKDLKLVRMRNSGHFILWKQPELILRELYALLEL